MLSDATVLVSSNEGALLSDLIINTVEGQGICGRGPEVRITRQSVAALDRVEAEPVPLLTLGFFDTGVGVAEFVDVDGSTVSPVSTSSEVSCPSARTNSSLASSSPYIELHVASVLGRGHPAASLSSESGDDFASPVREVEALFRGVATLRTQRMRGVRDVTVRTHSCYQRHLRPP